MKSKIKIPNTRIVLIDKIRCSNCSKDMDEGYVIHDSLEHYCSDECLNNVISEKEYKELYDQGYAFWTTFED